MAGSVPEATIFDFYAREDRIHNGNDCRYYKLKSEDNCNDREHMLCRAIYKEYDFCVSLTGWASHRTQT